MKQKRAKTHAARIGLLFGAATFVALSFLAGGLIEFSQEVGFFRWFADIAVYTLTNKLVYKLIAAFAVGGFAAFAANMIAYGKAIKQHKIQRVQFHRTEEAEQSTRIA